MSNSVQTLNKQTKNKIPLSIRLLFFCLEAKDWVKHIENIVIGKIHVIGQVSPSQHLLPTDGRHQSSTEVLPGVYTHGHTIRQFMLAITCHTLVGSLTYHCVMDQQH